MKLSSARDKRLKSLLLDFLRRSRDSQSLKTHLKRRLREQTKILTISSSSSRLRRCRLRSMNSHTVSLKR
nr:MAG TPA: hypothetical protein [Caudoviricetes sp.]